MPSPNLSEILTTTLYSRTGELADNVTKNNALLSRLKKRGKIKTVSGGESILQELEYAENSTYTRYSGYEVINIQPSDVFTSAQFQWKQAAVTVSISGLEGEVQNTGKERIISLMSSRIRNAERSANNGMWQDLYSDGTASGGKQVGGLQLLVADAPTTGTVGGINRATWTFWRNQKYQTTSDGGSAASSANIQRYMNGLYFKLVRGQDKPDLILTDTAYYTLYLQSLTAIQRITSDDMASAGFTSLKYMGADVVLDGFAVGNAGVASGAAAGCPANHMYMLNTEYIHYRPHVSRQWSPLENVRSINQDATVKTVAWAGNMTLSNAFLQGVMFQT